MPVEDYTYLRQGKKAINYKGLLHLAHERWGEQGFSLGAKILNPDFAWGDPVVTESSLGCPVGRFQDIGDASPENVPQNIAPHYPRMAATRGKARVLRDALDIGAVAVEELADDDEPAQQAGTAGRARDEKPPDKAGETKQKKGELLNTIRANLKKLYGDQAPETERALVRKSQTQTPFNKLSVEELEQWAKWSEGKVEDHAQAQARKQAKSAEEEGNQDQEDDLPEPPF